MIRDRIMSAVGACFLLLLIVLILRGCLGCGTAAE